MAGHGGEFSGYYCKFESIVDHKLLCAPSRSRLVEEVTMVTGEPECVGDPANYGQCDPEPPPNYQQWLMIWMPEESSYRIINRNSGMLLCVQSRTDKENHRIVQYHDQCLNFQWWELQAIDMDRFKIMNKKSRKVLTSKAGSVVQQTSDPSAQRQLWNIFVLEHSGYIGEYNICDVNSSKFLCIRSQSLSDNAKAIIYEDVSLSALEEQYANYQAWRLYVRGWDRGGFVIQNSHSGKILCVSGQSVFCGAKIIQHQNQELPHQKWRILQAYPDQMKIVNVHSARFLSVQDRATKNDSTVVQLQDQNQCWQLSRLSGDSEIDFHTLLDFYHSPWQPTDSNESEEATSMTPEMQLWYETFLKAFFLEVLVLLGVFPAPCEEDMATIIELILSNTSVVSELKTLLADGISFDSEVFVSIFSLLWHHNLWSPIFLLLLREVWCLPTLVKATVTIRSIILGAGTARAVFLLNKAVIVLGLIYNMKPLESAHVTSEHSPSSLANEINSPLANKINSQPSTLASEINSHPSSLTNEINTSMSSLANNIKSSLSVSSRLSEEI